MPPPRPATLAILLPPVLLTACWTREPSSVGGPAPDPGAPLQVDAAAPPSAPTDRVRPTGALAPVHASVADLIGRDVRRLLPGRWFVDPAPGRAARATLVRWWTDTCPYCRASLPWFERLRVEEGARGLDVRAVHHPKPPRLPLPAGSQALAQEDERVKRAAEALGFHGALARDPDWTQMMLIHPAAGRTLPTSFSLLLDAQGVVVWAHPGPELFPEDAPLTDAGRDWQDLREALDLLLGDADDSPASPR